MPWNYSYALSQDAHLQLIWILGEHSPDFLLLGGQDGVIALRSNCERCLEFAYRLCDDSEEGDWMAQHRDSGLDAIYIGADFSDNRGPFPNSDGAVTASQFCTDRTASRASRASTSRGSELSSG